MFYEILNRYIGSWVENYKLEFIFSDKRKPDLVLTGDDDIALVLKYDSKSMNAPVVLLKGKGSYARKIVQVSQDKSITLVTDKLLAEDLFSGVKTGQEIPPGNYEKIAAIFAKITQNHETADEHKNDCFDDIFSIQRERIHETLSIQPPEKIQLELSRNIFSCIRPKDLEIMVLGMQISNIKIIKNDAILNDAFLIKLNGTIVRKGVIKYLTYLKTDPVVQLKFHLVDTLTNYAGELLGRDDVLKFISQLKDKYPVLIQDILKYYSIGEIRKILRELLHENIAIQNIITILETIADFGEKKANTRLIVTQIKKALGNDICLPYLDNNIPLR